MSSHKGVRSLIALGVITIGAVATVASWPQDARPRSVRASAGRSIAAALRPGENRLVVVSPLTRPLMVEPPEGESPAAFYAGLSDAVLRVRVTSRKGHLTSQQDWIKTHVSVEVLDVLKAHHHLSVTTGGQWQFEEEGGELAVGETTVLATVPWARSVRTDGEYLLFVVFDDSGRAVMSAANMYEDTSDGLVSLATGLSDRTRNLGPLADAATRIRARAGQGASSGS